MKIIIYSMLLTLLFCSSVYAESNTIKAHVFVLDRDQQYALAGKTQAEERFGVVWHYWSDVDLIEDEMAKALPNGQKKALLVLKQRIASMTDQDKTMLAKSWRGRHMASDLGINPGNMPAVWADGRIFTHVEDLRHVFSGIK
ncbi:hypothetical protein A3197_17600 [Candidatus Thiodiazotropha endoloripes]|nr:hypothetical protein A3197_17600 [Candidatus Thiodiazotropha endoloripes]